MDVNKATVIMQPFAKVLIFIVALFIFFFGRHTTAKYTAESSLGPCFQNITGGYVLFFERSAVECFRECKRRPRCQTIRYDRPILICMLYSTNITQASPSGCFQASREEFINRIVRFLRLFLLKFEMPPFFFSLYN